MVIESPFIFFLEPEPCPTCPPVITCPPVVECPSVPEVTCPTQPPATPPGKIARYVFFFVFFWQLLLILLICKLLVTMVIESPLLPFYRPATCFVLGWQVQWLLCLFCVWLLVCWSVDLCVPTYHMHNNYVTYIVAMQLYFSQLRQLLSVATMCSPALLWVWDGYQEAEAM